MTFVLAVRDPAAGVPTPVRPPLPARVAWIYTGVGALALLTLAVGPPSSRLPASLLVVAGGVWAMTYGMTRNALPGHRAPWRWMTVTAWLFLGTMLVRMLVPGVSASPPGPMALLPNVFAVPAYLCIGMAFAGMLRRRRSSDDDPARVDALLVGLATGFLTWIYLIGPTMDQGGMLLMRLANSSFPIIDAVLLVMVAQLALAGGVRQFTLWQLLVASVALFAGDVIFTLRDSQLADISTHTLDVLFMTVFVLFGAAPLHPSMRTLTEPQQVVVQNLGKVRLAVIALMVVVPIVVTTIEPARGTLDAIVRSSLCVLLVVVVLGRVVRSHNSRARAESASRHRATHDALTELPNRELLAETIAAWGEQPPDRRQDVSLLFIDLDRFKMVNDNWGHRVGDELLRAVAVRLRGQVRAGDLVCRIGGDEFVIALAGPAPTTFAESLANRVLHAFAEPFRLSVGTVVVSASIGVARALGGTQAPELIQDADTAMYRAKGAGRNTYVLFDSSMRDQVRDRVRIEQALRGALDNGELTVHFQPLVDLGSDELDGFEALMRWHSPELGPVSPLDFIPVAEETGLIVESGAWLLRESVRQLQRWIGERPASARPLHVSVNVSVRQLRDGALVGVVRDVLAETGLDPASLWLEITESGVMEDVETAISVLTELRALGVVLCVDDFGTGYSSLSYLHRLPVGIVKIDRAFVAGVGEDGTNEPIVRAVLAMTHAMGQRVVAEGVETRVQRDWLRAQGCDLAQGWFYGRPERADALDGWVRDGWAGRDLAPSIPAGPASPTRPGTEAVERAAAPAPTLRGRTG